MKLSKKQKLGLDLFHFLGIEPLTVAVLATYLSTTEDFLQQIGGCPPYNAALWVSTSGKTAHGNCQHYFSDQY